MQLNTSFQKMVFLSTTEIWGSRLKMRNFLELNQHWNWTEIREVSKWSKLSSRKRSQMPLPSLLLKKHSSLVRNFLQSFWIKARSHSTSRLSLISTNRRANMCKMEIYLQLMPEQQTSLLPIQNRMNLGSSMIRRTSFQDKLDSSDEVYSIRHLFTKQTLFHFSHSIWIEMERMNSDRYTFLAHNWTFWDIFHQAFLRRDSTINQREIFEETGLITNIYLYLHQVNFFAHHILIFADRLNQNQSMNYSVDFLIFREKM